MTSFDRASSEAGMDDGGRGGLPWKRAAIKKCLKALNAALEEPNPAFDLEVERARMSMRREPERDTPCIQPTGTRPNPPHD